VLAGLFVIGGAGIAIAGASPQASIKPSQAIQQEGPARVKAMIAATDRANDTFVLTDGEANLTVQANQQLPTRVAEGKTLLAEGNIVHEDERVVLEANRLELGCPSKYEA